MHGAHAASYDELGLVPAQRANNGYRRYGAAEVDRLHQVLLYRECGMPLAAIGRLLYDPAFDARDALAGHLRELHARKRRLDGLTRAWRRRSPVWRDLTR